MVRPCSATRRSCETEGTALYTDTEQALRHIHGKSKVQEDVHSINNYYVF